MKFPILNFLFVILLSKTFLTHFERIKIYFILFPLRMITIKFYIIISQTFTQTDLFFFKSLLLYKFIILSLILNYLNPNLIVLFIDCNLKYYFLKF